MHQTTQLPLQEKDHINGKLQIQTVSDVHRYWFVSDCQDILMSDVSTGMRKSFGVQKEPCKIEGVSFNV